tara:strand:+ start:1853 stop:3556 length:1704 start_codon:yes stop_codon:yes gene_type:complete
MSKKTNQRGYYLGNRNLPTEDAEFEWTSEMIANIKKSSKNLLFFAETFFTIVNLDKGRDHISLYKCQKRVLRALRDNRFNIVLASRQIGKTTLMCIYALWASCFNDDQRILIVANKEQTAINIFKRVRLAYEELPNWLKPGVVEYGKTSMLLSNGSSIGISTTSSDAGRGDSCNVLILDELAFIDNHLVQDFWKSVYPIISSSKKSKIFIASTPNGTANLFYELYTNALKGANNWRASRVDWHEIPGRDEQWKNDTIMSLGSKQAFDQEFGNHFIEPGETAIADGAIEKFKITVSDPSYVFDDGQYRLWEQPNPDHIYTVGVDIAEGVGEAASVIQILDITQLTDIRQVAVYRNNEINPHLFTSKLLEILGNWGNPVAAIERNNCGAQVVDNLRNIHGYENLVHFSPASSKDKYDRPGVIAHTNTKYKGVTNMRYWINEVSSLALRDHETVEELKTFVRYPNGTWSAQRGMNMYDDRVMALIWSLIVLENSITEKYFEVVQRDKNEKPLELKSFTYGEKQFTDPLSLYGDELNNEYGAPPPMIMNTDIGETYPGDHNDLITLGYEIL